MWILVFPKTQKSQTFELQFIIECSSQKKKKYIYIYILVNVINMEMNSYNGLVFLQAHYLIVLIQELQIHLFLNCQGTGSENERNSWPFNQISYDRLSMCISMDSKTIAGAK